MADPLTLTILVISSMIFSVAATVYQRQRMRKLQQKAAEEADKQKGFQLVGEGSSDPINVFYGRNKVGGTRVYHRVLNWYSYAAPAEGGQVFTSAGKLSSSLVTSANIYYIEANDGTNYYIRGSKDNTNTIVASNANVTTTKITLNIGTLQTAEAAVFNNCYTNGYRITIRHYPLFLSEYGNNTTNTEVISASYLIDGASSNFNTGLIVLVLDPYTSSLRTESLLATNVHSTDYKNEFLYVQQVIGYGGIQGVVSVDIDDKSYSEKSWWDRDTPGGSVRIHVYPNGGLDPMINASITAAKTQSPVDTRANDDKRESAYFTNTAYASMVFRLHRNDPQFQGIPTVQFYLEGMKVAPILYNNGTYSLGAKAYSNNPALCLLDYLLNSTYGKGLTLSQIDLSSFYHAMQICDRLVALDNNNTLSVTNVGKFWSEKGGARQIKLYECNLGIDTSKPVRDNIEVLLETMGQAELVWSGGVYKLQLEYPLVYGKQYTTYMASGSHTVLFGAGSYNVGDIVQYSSGTPSTPDLYRALQPTNNNLPTVLGTYWAKDVTKAYLTDDDIIRDEQIGQSWPSLQNKHNYYTVKFLNESKDFAEDSISWPSKSGTEKVVYDAYLLEDGMPLESETFQTGDSTEWHAKATAEQIVRASRNQVIFKFSVPIKYAFLEPGDFIKVTSTILSIPGELLKVEEVKVNDKMQAEIQAIKFDANVLAWNAKDNEIVPARDIYFNKYGIATNLAFVSSTSGLIAGTLSWTPTGDGSVVGYSVKYTTELRSRIWAGTSWETLPTTTGSSIDIPSLPDGKYVFAVVSVLENGALIPYINPQNGVQWPLLEATIVQTPIVSTNYSVFISNTEIIQRNDDNTTFSPSTIIINGYQYTSALTAYNGYYTVETYNGTSWTLRYSATTPATNYTYTVIDCKKIRVRMYSTYSNSVLSGLLDEEIISVVDYNEFSIVVVNDNATIPADSSGNVTVGNLVVANSNVYVAKGITRQELTATAGGEAGKWNIIASPSTGLTNTFTIDTVNKQYTSAISAFNAANDTGTITFTATAKDSVTGVTLPTISDVQTLSKSKSGSAGTPGADAILIDLKSDADVVFAQNDGTGYTLPTGNLIRAYKAGVLLTNAANGITFGGTATQNGLTCTINSTTGDISLSGASWTSNQEFFNITATYNGTTYTITYTITKSKQGTDAIIADLLSESDTIFANNDGTGYTLPTGNALKLYKGGTVISSGVTYSGPASAQNGLTCSINSTSGVITLSGASWTSNQEFFTLTATYNSIAYTAIYSISKSKAGAQGTSGYVVTPSATTTQFTRSYAGTITPTTINLSGTATGFTPTQWKWSRMVNGVANLITTINGSSPAYNNYTPVFESDKTCTLKLEASADGVTWYTGVLLYLVYVQEVAPAKKYATVYLYQWSTSQPSNPTNNATSVYTWGTSTHGSYNAIDGWSVTAPPNSGIPGLKLWTASKTLEEYADITTTNITWSTGTYTVSINTGNQGLVQSATATVYQWAITIPTIIGTNTYTWSTGAISTPVPTGWSLTEGIAPGPGYTLWGASVNLVESTSTATSTIVWATSSITARNFATTDNVSSIKVCSDNLDAYNAGYYGSYIAINGYPIGGINDNSGSLTVSSSTSTTITLNKPTTITLYGSGSSWSLDVSLVIKNKDGTLRYFQIQKLTNTTSTLNVTTFTVKTGVTVTGLIQNGDVATIIPLRTGHTLSIIDPTTGNVDSTINYDTYNSGTTTLVSALNNVSDGKIIALRTFDACSITGPATTAGTLRYVLNNSFGGTSTNTANPARVSHTFIGQKNRPTSVAVEGLIVGTTSLNGLSVISSNFTKVGLYSSTTLPRTCYARFASGPTTTVAITTTGDNPPNATESNNATTGWGMNTAWTANIPSGTNTLYASDGVYNSSVGKTTWNTPYKSSTFQGAEDPSIVVLTATSQSFTYDTNGAASPTSQSITFNALLSGAIAGQTATINIDAYDSSKTKLGNLYNGNANTYTLTNTAFLSLSNSTAYVVATATYSTYSDTITVVKLKDGRNAVSGYLTNEAVTLAADNAGVVASYALATGTFKVFDGTADKTTSSTFSIVGTPTGLTAGGYSIGANNGVYSVTSGMTADNASITFQASYTSNSVTTTIQKIFTLTKSKAGPTGSIGATGPSGATGVTGASYTCCYATVTNATSFNVATITKTGTSITVPTSTDSSTTWGTSTTWSLTSPGQPSAGYTLWQSDGIFNGSSTVWSAPYISALKVGTLSALAVNTGALTVNDNVTIGSGGNLKLTNGAIWCNSTYPTTPYVFPAGTNNSSTTGRMFYLDSIRFRLGNSDCNLSFDTDVLNANGNYGLLAIKGAFNAGSGNALTNVQTTTSGVTVTGGMARFGVDLDGNIWSGRNTYANAIGYTNVGSYQIPPTFAVSKDGTLYAQKVGAFRGYFQSLLIDPNGGWVGSGNGTDPNVGGNTVKLDGSGNWTSGNGFIVYSKSASDVRLYIGNYGTSSLSYTTANGLSIIGDIVASGNIKSNAVSTTILQSESATAVRTATSPSVDTGGWYHFDVSVPYQSGSKVMITFTARMSLGPSSGQSAPASTLLVFVDGYQQMNFGQAMGDVQACTYMYNGPCSTISVIVAPKDGYTTLISGVAVATVLKR